MSRFAFGQHYFLKNKKKKIFAKNKKIFTEKQKKEPETREKTEYIVHKIK